MKRLSNPFGPLSRPMTAAIVVILWFALLLVFRGQPQWDIAISGWFFDGAACAATERAGGSGCDGFTPAGSAFLQAARSVLHPLPVVLGVILLVVLVVEVALGKRWRDGGVRLKAVLIATFVIGPGLIVNAMLKPHWGRPRPWMTEEFGGSLPFVEAGRETDLCAANCSFVSGEASAAGWLMCVALLLAVRGWRWGAVAAAVASFVMASLRIAFGAHYMSDTVLGFTMTIAIFMALAAVSEVKSWRRARAHQSS